MSKHIPVTPVIKGKDAERILDEMLNGTPRTPQREETFRRAKEVYETSGLKPSKNSTCSQGMKTYLGQVGHLSCTDPQASSVDKVYVDGKHISDVTELNDIEGWVKRLVVNNDHTYSSNGFFVEHLKGKVEVWLRL